MVGFKKNNSYPLNNGMAWIEFYTELNKLKSDFDKSYKSFTQNRTIQQNTINKNADILKTRFNKARILIYDQIDRLDTNYWSRY